ncbi:AMIN domain-containing protein [Synechococcales cyanobacterium C]|uniref:AMIN domain-containing protein n=1 Tax=Petrachloros mirabilis ULC683 TaxID=2781853 RepID=A0A8K2A8X8_9CYAN|nr:N-acetylmuramoyl-L-alanine amidase [Petrachloros mirabilis]NCJ07555.1 AMIN domain-containing protein [Petrachloros mirabilis ULC683]
MRQYHGLQIPVRWGQVIATGGLTLSLFAWLAGIAPAAAASLEFWQFNRNQNALEFRTDIDVRPRVQLIPDPTRLVVDLPGIVLGRPAINQTIGTAIRSVRVGQFDPQTTRIVVELAPDYTVDPQQVKVEGQSPSQWSITLPTPQRVQVTSQSSTPVSRPTATPVSRTTPAPSAFAGLSDILVTADGLFLPTRGRTPTVKVNRSRDRRTITLELQGVPLADTLHQKKFQPQFHGIEEISVARTSSSQTQVQLRVDRNSPDWNATVSGLGGVVLLPQGGSAATRGNRPNGTVSLVAGGSPQGTTMLAQGSRVATINSIDLGGSQLLIRANQPISFTTGWERSAYRITLRSAQLAPGLQPPRVGSGSPFSRVEIRSVDAQTVNILATPTTGVRITGVQRLDAQSVVVNLARVGGTANIPTPSTPSSAPVMSPGSQPMGRRVVVIDPGHGGPDPGAVGIGGLRETDVVLPISLEVARLLQQQGVQVHLTRQSEVNVELQPRVSLAERTNANVFVSIHANAISMSRPDVNGLETYHAPGSTTGNRLAQAIHNSILRRLNIRDRGVRSARFYVLRQTSMPAVLVETGFVTGAEDAPRLRDPNWQRQMAAAIAQGILDYMASN